jgi:cobalt-zinc-cadmium efflux system protein
MKKEKLTCEHPHCPLDEEEHDHGGSKKIEHHHGHHNHHKPKQKRVLIICSAIIFTVMIVEYVGGWYTNSLSLVSDAGHMLTHFLALAVGLFAMILATKKVGPEFSFGLYRVEILAALFNAFFLFLITIYIFYEAYQRIIHPEGVQATEMLIVAVIGLVVNLLVAFLLLKGTDTKDLNIKGIFYHMLADTVSSVGVIGGAVLISFTGWKLIDPLISIFIGILILIWIGNLVRDVSKVLLARAPKEIEIKKLRRRVIKKIPEVKDMHDIHVWVITSGMYNLMAHVVVDNIPVHSTIPVTKKIDKLLRHEFKISHTTFQYECDCVRKRECKEPPT